MKKPGRKSAAELDVVIDVGRKMPPRAPAELTDAQAAVWRDVVATTPGDWIDKGNAAVLTEYCRRVCRARLAESLVRRFEAEWIKVEGGLERLDRLLAIADRESKAITSLARALRLTPQSRMHARSAARRTVDSPEQDRPRPWDDVGGST